MEQKRTNRYVKNGITALSLLALVLGMKVGGGLFLSVQGLAWRCWIDGSLSLAGAALTGWFLSCLLRWMAEDSQIPGWVRGPTVVLGTLLTVWILAGFLFLFCLFGSLTDQVEDYEGQKVVVEHTGIFEETGYRYVNVFLHGEEVYAWRD